MCFLGIQLVWNFSPSISKLQPNVFRRYKSLLFLLRNFFTCDVFLSSQTTLLPKVATQTISRARVFHMVVFIFFFIFVHPVKLDASMSYHSCFFNLGKGHKKKHFLVLSGWTNSDNNNYLGLNFYSTCFLLSFYPFDRTRFLHIKHLLQERRSSPMCHSHLGTFDAKSSQTRDDFKPLLTPTSLTYHFF
jgi:hypothetical protein